MRQIVKWAGVTMDPAWEPLLMEGGSIVQSIDFDV